MTVGEPHHSVHSAPDYLSGPQLDVGPIAPSAQSGIIANDRGLAIKNTTPAKIDHFRKGGLGPKFGCQHLNSIRVPWVSVPRCWPAVCCFSANAIEPNQ